MKVYKKKDKIIFEIPYWSKRSNPFTPDEYIGEYQTLTALIEKDEYGDEEMGWAYTIDMSYAGKDDQFTSIMIYWLGEKKEFLDINQKLGLIVINLCPKTKRELKYLQMITGLLYGRRNVVNFVGIRIVHQKNMGEKFC